MKIKIVKHDKLTIQEMIETIANGPLEYRICVVQKLFDKFRIMQALKTWNVGGTIIATQSEYDKFYRLDPRYSNWEVFFEKEKEMDKDEG